jgi:protein gp37
MADMFGEWIPAEWIKEILKICTSVPQHRHLFLTKNPERYSKVFDEGSFIDRSDRLWFGQTVTKPKDYIFLGLRHTFVNLEPLLSGNGTERMFESLTSEESTGVILGAMTGPGSKKHQPKREWIDSICAAADEAGIPVFMKDSLAGIVGEENMRRELPWA